MRQCTRDVDRWTVYDCESSLWYSDMQIREAQLAQYNYILVVGEKEQVAETVNVRTRDNQVHGEHTLSDVIEVMSKERSKRSLTGLFGEDAGKSAAPGAEAASAEA